jgi:DNA/RNA endonuclease G (NUC1)
LTISCSSTDKKAAPQIASQPAALVVKAGQPASFSVTVTGTAPLTYQWSKDGAALGGATSPILTIAATTVADAGSYTVTATNAQGSATSNPASLTVNVPPTIATQPVGATLKAGDSASLVVVPGGAGPFTYQWYKDTAALTGATSATYPIAAAKAADAGSYTVMVTNAGGSVSSDAAVVVVNLPPTIATQPLDLTVTEGLPVQFSVVPGGAGPFTFQWNKGGVPLPGATQNPFSLAAAGAGDAGSYSVTVSNLGGSVLSASANLVVNPAAPAITADPKSVTVRPPDGATFSVTATGPGLTYSWMKNGTAITGANGSTCRVASTDLHATSDQYTVQVTSGTTVLTSKAATLAVQAPKAVYAGDPQALGNTNYTVVGSYLATLPSDPTGSFRVGYDTAKLNPLWSAACFFPSAPWTFARPGTYPTDDRIPGSLATGDYTSTGWSRGHQTGFADLRDCYGADAGASTMYMSNMCPQDQTFNGGEWGNFETLCTLTYPAAFGRVWVYTGPIFGAQIVNPIGPKNIPVPNAFYKILVRETAAGTPKVLAAIVPNSSTIGRPGVAMADTDFWKFVTSVDRVQELTGLTFFPSPTSPLPAGFTSTVDVSGWGAPLEQGPNKPNVHMINPSWDTEYKHIHNSNNNVYIIDLTTAVTGTPVTFKAQASPDPDAITSTSWNFGDGSATDPNPTTTHAFANAGTFTVTFSATDAANHTNSISRTVTIAGSTPTGPSFSAIADVNTNNTTPKTVAFTVSDAVTLGGGIVVTAHSDTPSVLADSLVVANDNGYCSLVLNPVASAVGTATVTLTATNGANLVGTATFKFNVAATPVIPSGTLLDGFDTATKSTSGYTAGDLTSGTNVYAVTDVLLFDSTSKAASDHWNGTKGLRMQNKAGGKLTMKSDWASAKTVSVAMATYGTETGSIGLWASTDGGATWTQVGSTFAATAYPFTTVTWNVNYTSPVRFEIRRTDALSGAANARINLDDFQIVGQ